PLQVEHRSRVQPEGQLTDRTGSWHRTSRLLCESVGTAGSDHGGVELPISRRRCEEGPGAVGPRCRSASGSAPQRLRRTTRSPPALRSRPAPRHRPRARRRPTPGSRPVPAECRATHYRRQPSGAAPLPWPPSTAGGGKTLTALVDPLGPGPQQSRCSFLKSPIDVGSRALVWQDTYGLTAGNVTKAGCCAPVSFDGTRRGTVTGVGTYYWDNDPNERVFMEVTRRESIGEDIEAPVGRDAGANYALVRCLRFGDVVLHYKTDAEAILGASIVTGDPEPASTYWAAHDGKEQKANARPAWLPGIRVPIDHLVEVDPPITLDELRRHENDLMAIRDDLQQRYPKAPLYFPWARYRGGSSPMRTLQSYLVKFPRAAVDVIPRLRAVVDMAQGARIGRVEGPSELELAQAAIATSAGRRYARRGQGFLVNQKMSVAIEVLAMNCAI